jgi:hypothetical protein
MFLIFAGRSVRLVGGWGGGGEGGEAGGQTSLCPALRKHLSSVSIHISYLVDHSDRQLTFLDNTFSIRLSVCLLVGTAWLLVCLHAFGLTGFVCLFFCLSAALSAYLRPITSKLLQLYIYTNILLVSS